MPRVLHTADWLLGSRPAGLVGTAAAEAREARFRAVERVAHVAHERAVDVIVVAGDTFADNQVSPATVARARVVLRAFAPIPVLLLPGTHDAAEPGCVLDRLVAAGESELAHIRVARDTSPIEVGGVVVFPCPLRGRHAVEDPTAALPDRSDSADTADTANTAEAGVRIAVAHGGALGAGPHAAVHRIDVARVLSRGFDYVALGGVPEARSLDPRAGYCGTPEPIDPTGCGPHEGGVLVVDLPAPGAVPQVEVVPLAREIAAGGEIAAIPTITADAPIDAPGFLGEALAALVAVDDDAHRDAARLLRALFAEVAR